MRKIKEKLKENDTLRRIIKKQKIRRAFMDDADDFSRYYLETAEENGDHRYRIMLLLHGLEKGLCASDPRPFGKEKVKDLMSVLKECKDEESFEYLAGLSILNEWCKKFEEMEWQDVDPYQEVKAFLSAHDEFIETGAVPYYPPKDIDADAVSKAVLSRRSAREYEKKEIDEEDLKYALEFFRSAPSACNRQMCRIYRAEGRDAINALEGSLMGLSGFDKDTVTYFVVTFDIAAFDFAGERNQGYLNAGLAAMNFVNGLHARGIGSCFMQWANKRKEDVIVRKILEIEDSERIAVVIGAGYYKDGAMSPVSARKPIEDIYKTIK